MYNSFNITSFVNDTLGKYVVLLSDRKPHDSLTPQNVISANIIRRTVLVIDVICNMLLYRHAFEYFEYHVEYIPWNMVSLVGWKLNDIQICRLVNYCVMNLYPDIAGILLIVWLVFNLLSRVVQALYKPNLVTTENDLRTT